MTRTAQQIVEHMRRIARVHEFVGFKVTSKTLDEAATMIETLESRLAKAENALAAIESAPKHD